MLDAPPQLGVRVVVGLLEQLMQVGVGEKADAHLGRATKVLERGDGAAHVLGRREEGDQVAVVGADDDEGTAPPEGDDDTAGVGGRGSRQACGWNGYAGRVRSDLVYTPSR